MQNRRKERGKTIGLGKKEWRAKEAVPCKAMHNSESEEASEKSSVHLHVVQWLPQ